MKAGERTAPGYRDVGSFQLAVKWLLTQTAFSGESDVTLDVQRTLICKQWRNNAGGSQQAGPGSTPAWGLLRWSLHVLRLSARMLGATAVHSLHSKAAGCTQLEMFSDRIALLF